MINFDTDRLIIFYYPSNAGGKFLINSLGLSDSAVFQDKNLAEQQLIGNFSSVDKLNYLLEKINQTNNQWNDLDLGCGQLFGQVGELILFLKDYPLNNEIRKYFDFEDIIETLSKSKKYFFKTAHFTETLKKEMMFWPNAKIVEFVNYNPFIEKYRILDNQDWMAVKGKSWPDNYPTIREYLQLDIEIQNDINQYFKGFEYFQKNPTEADRIIFTWDASNYLDLDVCKTEFAKLCSVLNINDIDLDDFSVYYKSWINKIDELKNYRNNQ